MAINISSFNGALESESIRQISFSNFTLANFLTASKPLIIFIIAMTVYAIFVFKFYRFLARRDILDLETHKYYSHYQGLVEKVFRSIFYVLENLILIPVLVFFWFAVLSGLLLFLSKSTTPDTVLLTGASIVAAVRITAYYNENLSQDLAKMIPFALLGVFLVDMSYFSMDNVWGTAKMLPSMFDFAMYYMLFVIALEFVLRIFHAVFLFAIKKEKKAEYEGA